MKALSTFLSMVGIIAAMSGCGGTDNSAMGVDVPPAPPVDTYPPDGMQCTALLDPSGTVPTMVPKALAAKCSACHGPAAYGVNQYPNLHLLMITFDQFSGIVRQGKSGSIGIMPAFVPSELSDDDIRRIYAFVTKSPILETHQCQPAS
jgi:mono/diheme cytochrome c family protein